MSKLDDRLRAEGHVLNDIPGLCPACHPPDKIAKRLQSLSDDLRAANPGPNTGSTQPLPVDPRPHSGPASGITANINHVTTSRGFTQPFVTIHDKLRAEGHDLSVDDLADCPACQTTRTTTRGFTYDLATMLGEGHYEEDPP